MRIKFCGAAHTVTGSCFLVSACGRQVLIDCGLFQGSKALAERNYNDFPFNPAMIEAVVLTHAHIDHTGLLPKLVKQGFRGAIYATAATRDLCSVMLPDSAYIQESEVERKNRKLARQGHKLLEPMYTIDDANLCMQRFRAIPYHEQFSIYPGIDVVLRPSGHVLGSAYVELTAREGSGQTKVLFSGDIGAENRPLVPDPDDPGAADYVVMESTYGDRLRHEQGDVFGTLAGIIKETFARGGNVIIPAFAVERTQDLLYGLNKLIYKGELTAGNVYVDSPLAVEATEIFAKHVDLFDEEAQHFRQLVGDIPILLPNLRFLRTKQESESLNKVKSGAVIISASGMCTAGRVKHHLKHNLWRPECSVVFVGYQAQGTLGRNIADGQPIVRIHGEEVKVRAKVHMLDGFSAHADQRQLVEWIGELSHAPKGIFLVHGEEEALSTMRQLVEKKTGATVHVPDHLSEYALEQETPVIALGVVLEAADVLSPTLWGSTLRLIHALQDLERAQVPQAELERLLMGAEALRAEVEQAVKRQGVA